jgi:hypothetical protein
MQVRPAPVQASGAHAGSPTDPAGAGVHSPSRAAPLAAAQTSQAPSQALLQQNPSTQS